MMTMLSTTGKSFRSWLSVLALAASLNALAAAASDFKAIKRTAEQGDAKAQYVLGRMYENGAGVGESCARAARWYRKAAEQNCAPAQYGLGRLYAAGEGVCQDYTEAIK